MQMTCLTAQGKHQQTPSTASEVECIYTHPMIRIQCKVSLCNVLAHTSPAIQTLHIYTFESRNKHFKSASWVPL